MTGEWKEFEFESIIPEEYDENDNIILHKYINYKCSICGYITGNKQTDYCAECGTKMRKIHE